MKAFTSIHEFSRTMGSRLARWPTVILIEHARSRALLTA
jgi:hypothetical protein